MVAYGRRDGRSIASELCMFIHTAFVEHFTNTVSPWQRGLGQVKNLDLHDISFLLLQQLLNTLHILISNLLHLILQGLAFILP